MLTSSQFKACAAAHVAEARASVPEPLCQGSGWSREASPRAGTSEHVTSTWLVCTPPQIHLACNVHAGQPWGVQGLLGTQHDTACLCTPCTPHNGQLMHGCCCGVCHPSGFTWVSRSVSQSAWVPACLPPEAWCLCTSETTIASCGCTGCEVAH